jgi:glucokinase
VGRPPVVLGLDFGGTKIAVAVCDVQGNRLASATVSTAPRDTPAAVRTADGADPAEPPGAQTDGGTDAEASPDGQDLAQIVFQRAIRSARGLLDTAAPDSELVAVGASTFGIPHEDKIELAPAIDGWESLALGRELRAAFPGATIRMATDAKAAAAAEVRWGALHDCDPGIYLNLGTGLSAAIVAGGQVIVGANGAAGEFGYNLRSVADVGLELSQRTMLEEMVSGLALARRASGQPGRPPGLTAADVFSAGTGDLAFDRLVDDFVAELALHLVNLAILINPVRIAAGGGLVRSWDRIAPRLESALRAGPPFPPELVVGRFPYDAPLLGAVALAIDAATSSTGAPVALATADGAEITEIADTAITGVTDVTGVTSLTLNSNTGAQA